METPEKQHLSAALSFKTGADPESSSQRMKDLYNSWATTYDKTFEREGVLVKPDTVLVAKQVAEVLGDNKDSRIIDIAAGTGLVARELRKLGITNVDGLDASEEMLNLAQKDELYKNTFVRWVTPEPIEGIVAGSYDALVTTGSFAKGHLHGAELVELLRIVKPAGYVVVGIHVVNEVNVVDEFLCELDKLVTAGKCTILKKTHHDVFNFQLNPGYVFVLQPAGGD